jgi:hypothetical protein
MPRWNARPEADRTLELAALARTRPTCGGPLRAANTAHRTVVTLVS